MAKGRKKKTITVKKEVGLGDVVEKITKATGIKKVVQSVSDDCGCDGRKALLNKIKLSRGLKARCFTEEEYKSYKEFKELGTLRVLKDEQTNYICKLFADVFNRQYYKPCINCSPKPLIKMIDSLDIVFNAYE